MAREIIDKSIREQLVKLHSEADDLLPRELFRRGIDILVNNITKQSDDYDASKNALLTYFTAPEVKLLPFPADLTDVPERFTRFSSSDASLQNCNRLFECYGRVYFPDFVEWATSRMYEVQSKKHELFGNIGGGKSHLFAMYIIYLHCLRKLDNKQFVPLYIPECKNVIGEMDVSLLTAIQFGAIRENEVDDKLRAFATHFENQVEGVGSKEDFAVELKRVLVGMRGTVGGVPVGQARRFQVALFVDDWNALDNEVQDSNSADRTFWRNTLNNLRSIQRGVFARSPGCDTLAAAAREVATIESIRPYCIYYGLVPSEWAEVQGQTHIASVYGALSEEDKKEFEYLTGLVPMFITHVCALATALKTTLEEGEQLDWEAVKRLYYKSEKVGVGGTWIWRKLTTHLEEVLTQEKSKTQMEVLKEMIESISGDCESNTTVPFDPRFFYKKVGSLDLVPICGIVRILATDVLHKRADQLGHMHLLVDFKWYEKVRFSGNPTRHGDALEDFFVVWVKEYVKEHFATLAGDAHAVRFPPTVLRDMEVGVVRFDNDFPKRSQLNTNGITIYVPHKWNLRFMDLVVRAFGVDGVPLIVAMQVTLSKPVDHAGSIRFFTQPYQLPGETAEAQCDCTRYVLEEEKDTALFVLLWVLLESAVQGWKEDPVLPKVVVPMPTRSAKRSASVAFEQLAVTFQPRDQGATTLKKCKTVG